MNPLLRHYLLDCRDRYAAATNLSPVTVANKAIGDWRYFEKIEDGGTSAVTDIKFDQIMEWFDANWPDDAERPVPLDDWRAVKMWEAGNDYSVVDAADWPRILVCAHGNGPLNADLPARARTVGPARDSLASVSPDGSRKGSAEDAA